MDFEDCIVTRARDPIIYINYQVEMAIFKSLYVISIVFSSLQTHGL